MLSFSVYNSLVTDWLYYLTIYSDIIVVIDILLFTNLCVRGAHACVGIELPVPCFVRDYTISYSQLYGGPPMF